MISTILFLNFLLATSASTEGTFSVKLTKKPLDPERLAQQKQNLQAKILGGAANGGEDIPLLDFMDAQVKLHGPCLPVEYQKYSFLRVCC